ncbi:MAG: ParB/RepB/Spo0J family partition protein [Roseiflexaceae bacterium]
MSGKRGTWIARRGQADADLAIDQVIDQRPQPGEQIQMLADDQIADSPYQARRPFDEQSVEELAQGMREAGFQGVLVVRPHSDPPMRRRGAVQLVYGHRRRVAWRRVCAERGEPCLLPVVIREIEDQQLLTIGAQENLQRQDLDPVEEAQIVAWHQQMYFEKNQAAIGALLGKSEDWVKTRSRIQKLPDALKDRLRQRPRDQPDPGAWRALRPPAGGCADARRPGGAGPANPRRRACGGARLCAPNTLRR